MRCFSPSKISKLHLSCFHPWKCIVEEAEADEERLKAEEEEGIEATFADSHFDRRSSSHQQPPDFASVNSVLPGSH